MTKYHKNSVRIKIRLISVWIKSELNFKTKTITTIFPLYLLLFMKPKIKCYTIKYVLHSVIPSKGDIK